jgi:hypothetical protein
MTTTITHLCFSSARSRYALWLQSNSTWLAAAADHRKQGVSFYFLFSPENFPPSLIFIRFQPFLTVNIYFWIVWTHFRTIQRIPYFTSTHLRSFSTIFTIFDYFHSFSTMFIPFCPFLVVLTRYRALLHVRELYNVPPISITLTVANFWLLSSFRPFLSFYIIFIRFHPFLAVSTRSKVLGHVREPYNVPPILFALSGAHFWIFSPFSTILAHFPPFSFVLARFWSYWCVLKPYVTSVNPTTCPRSQLRSLSRIFDYFHLLSTFSLILHHFHSFSPVFGRIDAF